MSVSDPQHTHDWAPDDGRYACTGCPATTDPCNTCGRPLPGALAICDPCLDKARKVIDDIRDTINDIPDAHATLMGLHATRYDRPQVTVSDNPDRLPFNLDAAVDGFGAGGTRTPRGVTEILWSWADAWADKRGETASGDVYTYLTGHHLWAAQTPDTSGWHEYLTDIHTLRNVIRRLAGLDPVPAPAPCVHCGGRIVQDWTKDGLDDVHKCTRCGTTWNDHTHLTFAMTYTVSELPTTRPDALVTLEQVRVMFPGVRRNTLNQWIRRDRETDPRRIPERGATATGVPLYRLGDITARITAHNDERKAS